MIRTILTHPDPRLREPSRSVERFDEQLRSLVQDMFDTMHHAQGIGLAAVQIGVHLRVAVMEVENNPSRVLINPSYEPVGEAMNLQEGCLSIPGAQGLTKTRAKRVRVHALDLNGARYEFEAEGLEAACVQHECDHIAGKLYIDRMSELRRQRLLKRYQDEQRHRH